MTTPALLLVAAAGILLAINLIQGVFGIAQRGIPASLGNRDTEGEAEGLAGRIARTKANTIENLMVFAPVMGVAVAMGIENDWVIYGGMTYVGARVLYTIVYMAGIPGVRTLSWLAGVLGTVAVAVGLFG